MQLSWISSGPGELAGVAAAGEWHAQLERQAIVADFLGIDTLWLDLTGEEAGRQRQHLRALWRLSAVTTRVRLGAIVAAGGEAEIIALAGALAAPAAFSDSRHRVAVQLSGAAHVDALAGALLALGEALGPRGGEARTPPPPLARRVALLAEGEAAAARAGAHGLGLLLPARHVQPWIDAYRRAAAGQPAQVLLRTAVRLSGPERGRRAPQRAAEAALAPHELAGTSAQVATGLSAQAQATGCDEMIIAPAAVGHGEALRTIEVIGQEILPWIRADRIPADAARR